MTRYGRREDQWERIKDLLPGRAGHVRKPLAAAGKSAVIPPGPNRLTPPYFDRELYKARHLIENFCCKLKQFRAIATRYDKTATIFRPSTRSRHHLAQLTARPCVMTHRFV